MSDKVKSDKEIKSSLEAGICPDCGLEIFDMDLITHTVYQCDHCHASYQLFNGEDKPVSSY